MTLESKNVVPICALLMIVTFLFMLLKKKKKLKILAVEITILTMAVLCAANLFPLKFNAAPPDKFNDAFINYIPLINIRYLIKSVRYGKEIGSAESVAAFTIWLNALIKYCLLDFASAAIIGACIFYLTKNKLRAIMAGILCVWTVIVAKIILYNYHIVSIPNFFDTFEFIAAVPGALIGMAGIHTLMKFRRKKDNASYDRH